MPGPSVCSATVPCGKGHGCVLGRCRKDKTVPVESLATRITLTPRQMALVGRDDDALDGERGPAIVLGRRGVDRTALFDFGIDALELDEKAVIRRALIVLDPLPRCPVGYGEMRVEIAELLEPWRAEGVKARRLPRMSLPLAAGKFSITPPQPLRIDVTELAREWQQKGSFGIALLSSGTSASGGCYVGVGAGHGPRLEVFLAVPKKKKKKDDEKKPAAKDGKSKPAAKKEAAEKVRAVKEADR
jgi:hypothetical protein